MEFNDFPENIEELTVKTEPRGYNKLFAMRDFEIINNGETLGRVASSWALVDMTTKNMTSVGNVFGESSYMKPFEKRETDLNYNKIKPIQKIDNEQIFNIRYDDIDVNTHVNNSNYIIWAFETLDINFRSTKKLKTLDMMFKKEIKYGQKVLSQIEVLENKTNHVLKCLETNEDLCLISAEWAKK
jgi:medium-chain acyl-[acyl-carrier-protein] hydrolase